MGKYHKEVAAKLEALSALRESSVTMRLTLPGAWEFDMIEAVCAEKRCSVAYAIGFIMDNFIIESEARDD